MGFCCGFLESSIAKFPYLQLKYFGYVQMDLHHTCLQVLGIQYMVANLLYVHTNEQCLETVCSCGYKSSVSMHIGVR